MSSAIVAISSGTITVFRGQNSFFQFSPLDPDNNPITVPAGTTGTLIISTTISPDPASQLVTFTDLAESGGLLRKDFSIADTESIPLGTFAYEIQSDLGSAPVQVMQQGTLTCYPTILD